VAPDSASEYRVNKDRDQDLQSLLQAIVGEDVPEPPAPSPFERQLSARLAGAIAAMRDEGTVEVEEGRIDALVAEVTEAGLDSHSPKHLLKKVIRTMIESDAVEEVYGSDEVIAASLRRFLDPA